MSREGAIKVEGTVVQVLPNSLFRVALPNGHLILAHISGKTRLNFVRIMTGEKVNLEMSPYDLSKGSIVFKEK